MVTVRGRKKSLAPRMAPPREIRRRTESESEEELLEEDSNASTNTNEATFINAHANKSDVDTREGDSDILTGETDEGDKVVATADSTLVNAKDSVAATAGPATLEVHARGSFKPPKSDLNTTGGSDDSGHSEPMDTADKVEDGLVGFYGSVSLLEENVRAAYPITARPPCTVDAEMVSVCVVFIFITSEFRFKSEF